jgi:hypothetical protein
MPAMLAGIAAAGMTIEQNRAAFEPLTTTYQPAGLQRAPAGWTI